jgi:serine protease inhibitor
MDPLEDPHEFLPGLERMTRTVLAAGLLVLVTVGGSAETLAPADARNRMARASNAFGVDLYARLRGAEGNLAVSPASLSIALGMTRGGARGTTAAQMAKVLHLDGWPDAEALLVSGELAASLQDPSRPVTLRIANRLFGERSNTFDPAYLELTRRSYGAALEPLDFKGAPEAARGRINGWVSEQTKDRIRDLIPPGGIHAGTRLALVNALYFLGDWESPFEKKSTVPVPFHVSATVRKDVPTMHHTGMVPFFEDPAVKAVALPYRGGTMSMLLVLPQATDGLAAFEASLTPARLEALAASLKPREVAVALPRFEVNPAEPLALGDELAALGMTDAFDATKADFTGITNPPDPRRSLHLGAVFHKAFVRVDEKGTEAAAATAVIFLEAGALPRRIAQFKADHPFLFFLRDHTTGLVLFMGRVTDPSRK